MIEKMGLQALMDGMSMQWQRQRAETQMTLNELIAALEAMPEGAEVENLNSAHSYRGYYIDLAFELGEGHRPASDLLADCRAAMGEVFEGYKGGDFVMGALTPIWVANYGCCGTRLMAVHPNGKIKTAREEDEG